MRNFAHILRSLPMTAARSLPTETTETICADLQLKSDNSSARARDKVKNFTWNPTGRRICAKYKINRVNLVMRVDGVVLLRAQR